MSETIDPKLAERLVRHGEDLLRIFHEEYARGAVSPATEFRRGKVIEWRQLLNQLYGESVTEALVLRARSNTKLSVPPAGPLSPDGKSYEGFDSQCDAGYIGPIT